MTLAQLYEQQECDIEKYKAMRDKAWADLKAEHTQITASFGGEERVSYDSRKLMDQQLENYFQEWPMYTGERHKAITEQHEKQRNAITGFTPPDKTEQVPELSKADRNAAKMDNRQNAMQEKIDKARPANNTPAEEPQEDNDKTVSAEQLQELHKIIAQQQAIRQRSQERKRGR